MKRKVEGVFPRSAGNEEMRRPLIGQGIEMRSIVLKRTIVKVTIALLIGISVFVLVFLFFAIVIA